MLNQQVRCSR